MPARDFTEPRADLACGVGIYGFTVEDVQQVSEIPGCAYIMRHGATGARLMWLACDDTNKAFAIAFKTPPADDTGVFHINEHSVLCGSRRFPVKEPFVNLLKTSMQTFLNAMTFPDKTVYPVSSTNEQDLLNLMDVYLDAVLHPDIYRRPRIFEQEGWHYELGADGLLTRNGVVYNEMKGSLSDPDRMLMMQMNRALFPDTAYGYESGGDPESIPQLTYQAFLDANARHYKLDNSYTVLYGDLDIERLLAFIDGHFCGQEDRGAGDPNPLALQQPVTPPDAECEMRTAPENAAVGLGYVIGTMHDRNRVLAVDILLDALMGSNEAPLKRAVLQAGLGDDAYALLMDGQLQPYVFLELKGAKPGAADALRDVVESTCRDIMRTGFERERLESALSQAEFELREGNWGYSDGVALAIMALEGWLYDDAMPTDYLRYEDALAEARALLDNGGFERLLQQVFLENDHAACVTLNAADDDAADADAADLAHKLAELDDAGRAAIRAEQEALREEQEAPDSAEALATLPQLHVADIGPAPEPPKPLDDATAPLPCIGHELETHGIDYVYHYFGLEGLSFDELPYATLLGLLLGKLGTLHHTASQLETLVNLNLGELGFFCEVQPRFGSDEATAALVVKASALAGKEAQLAELPREVWAETLFDDRERVVAALQQARLALEQSMATSGHTWAATRLSGYATRAGVLTDQLSGVGFYRFLRGITDAIDDAYDGLVETLAQVSRRIFNGSRVVTSFTGTRDARARFWDAAGDMGLTRPAGTDASPRLMVPDPVMRSEAFVVPANVCFVTQAAVTGPEVPRLSGSWIVASRALSLDYLWNEVRVKGGAYGCGFSVTMNGRMRFHSYRDPAVDPTLERFAGSADWLAAWNPTRDELEGYIVSSVAKRDAPQKPRALARRQDTQRFAGITEELRTTLRDELLACTPDQVRALAAPLRDAAPRVATCVFGGKDQIAASTAKLQVVELF